MWLGLAFLSAFLLGFYDISKKKVLKTNPVLPVLCLNTFFSSLIFLPFIVCSAQGWIDADSVFFTHTYGWEGHKYILLKSVIVMGSWICGYYGIKNLPLTIVGPINATRPVMVLIGALTFLGEHLNVWQWIGVIIAIVSFYLLSRSGRKEGIDFRHNRWIALIVLSNVLGAVSALFDRWLLSPDGLSMDKMALQSWYNIYQCFMLSAMLLAFRFFTDEKDRTPRFHWDWCILCISVFLSAADFVYFYALTSDDAMVSIVSMIRRGSVLVSFLFAALVFKERNLRSKVFDLLLVILSLMFLFYGSR